MLQSFSGAYTFPVEEFIAIAETCMAAAPEYYCSPERKRAYIAAALTGRARLWFTRWVKLHGSASYEDLRSAILDEFHIEDKPTEDQRLRHLTQGVRGVMQYAQEFETAASFAMELVDTQYNRLWFAHGLSPSISQKVLESFTLCPTFDHLVLQAKHVEDHYKRLSVIGRSV